MQANGLRTRLVLTVIPGHVSATHRPDRRKDVRCAKAQRHAAPVARLSDVKGLHLCPARAYDAGTRSGNAAVAHRQPINVKGILDLDVEVLIEHAPDRELQHGIAPGPVR